MTGTDVVKTLLHAFALFQESVKSLLIKDVEEYIPHADLRLVINQNWPVTFQLQVYDVFVNAVGGGYAVKQELSITVSLSRALQVDPDSRFIETRRTSYT